MRRRIHYMESQKALMWERWQKGESLQQIAQLFDRNHSSIQGVLAATGGIRPARRSRSRWVAGKDTETVIDALIKNARKLPDQLYQSLTWDRGKEMADHKRFTLATDIKVYFCDPQNPWQRGGRGPFADKTFVSDL